MEWASLYYCCVWVLLIFEQQRVKLFSKCILVWIWTILNIQPKPPKKWNFAELWRTVHYVYFCNWRVGISTSLVVNFCITTGKLNLKIYCILILKNYQSQVEKSNWRKHKLSLLLIIIANDMYKAQRLDLRLIFEKRLVNLLSKLIVYWLWKIVKLSPMH